MQQIDKYYLGGVVSVLLLLTGYLLLPFREPGILPRLFSLLWIVMILLSAVSFISGIRRREQLAAIRKKWKTKALSRAQSKKKEKVSQEVKGYNSDEK